MQGIKDEEVECRKVNLDLKKIGKDKSITKLLIFDLDETLAHCIRTNTEGSDRVPDVKLNIRLQSGKDYKASFNIRPYTQKMLIEVNKYYEVAVFTASHKWYANVILDHIDPQNKFFQHRLYRESCIKADDSVYVKDLRVINNVPMKDMVLVDNAVYSFGAQLRNGIPITPFKENKQDIEFIFLKRFLVEHRHAEDLREPIERAFYLDYLSSRERYDYESFIEYYDLEDCEQEQDNDDEYEAAVLAERKRQEEQLKRSAGPPSEAQARATNSNGVRIAGDTIEVNDAHDIMPKSIQDSLDNIQEILQRQGKKISQRYPRNNKLNKHLYPRL